MAFDREIAIFTIACEASSASEFERGCVAAAMVNRVKSGRFGKSLAAVCLKRFQFSEWNDDAADNANLERVALLPNGDPVIASCTVALASAMSDWPDPTHGATHYHDKSISPPAWTVGAHLTLETDKFCFYANVK